MKKSVALLTSALLATSVVLGATSCASKDVSKLLPDGSPLTTNTKKLTALANMDPDELGSIDSQGLMIVEKENKDSDGNPVSTTYKLFNVFTNAYVSGVEVTIPAEAPEVAADALTKTESSELWGDMGFYFTVKSTFTRKTAEDDWSETPEKIEYTLYGKNGKVAENVEGELVTEMGDYDELVNVKFVAKDGTRYYLDVNGNLAKESNPLARIVELNDLEDLQFIGDYLVAEVEGYYVIYEKSGKYVRTVNGAYELDIPQNIAGEPAMWSVGNYMFVQYSIQLPENEKKYDYISDGADGAQKYDLVTKRYDLKKGKVKDIDMDYVVVVEDEVVVEEDAEGMNPISLNDETTILYVSEIKDDMIMDATLVQSFDKNGEVAVDLQKLVPGASDIEYIMSENALVLESGDMEYVVEGKKVVGEFVANSVKYMYNVAYTKDVVDVDEEHNSTYTYRFYNLDGSLNKAYTDVKLVSNADLSSFIFQLESSIVKYDMKSKTETVICTYDAENGKIDPSSFWIKTYSYGADKEAGTEDDRVSYYFLVPGMNNLVNLTLEEDANYFIDIVGAYGNLNADAYTAGAIFCVSHTTGEGENETTTTDYYTYEMSMSTAMMKMMMMMW